MDADTAALGKTFRRYLFLTAFTGLLFGGAAFSQEESTGQQPEQVRSSIEPTMPTPKLPYNMPIPGVTAEARANQLSEVAPTSVDGNPLKPVFLTNPQSIGSAVPMPEKGTAMPIARPDQIITNAGGEPRRFEPPPVQPQQPVQSQPTAQSEPTIVPAEPVDAFPQPSADPVQPTERKRRLFGKLFRKKQPENQIIDENSTFIANLRSNPGPGGPSDTPPSAPVPAPVAQNTNAPAPKPAIVGAVTNRNDQAKNKFVIVDIEGGTQFFIVGASADRESGILIPDGTVLQKIGTNGAWTTVESPNGTTGNVQTLAVREASFAESMTFIKSEQQ